MMFLIERPHLALAEAHPFHGAGPEVLDQHVGLTDQVPEHGFAVVGFKVEDDGTLTPVAGEEHGAQTVVRDAEVAHLLATRRFHLDHVRTLIAEHHRRNGP